jgi:DNA polymerase-3 subunit beta
MLADLGIALGADDLTEAVSALSGDTAGLDELDMVAEEPDAPPAFTMSRMVFSSMLAQVMLVVPTRDFYPPLKNVVIEVSDDKLVLIGSDSTSWVLSSTSALQVEHPGRVLIGASRFASVVSKAAGASITIRCEGTMMHLSSGTASWSLRVAAAQDYPASPDLGDITWCDVDRHALRRAFDGTRFAVSRDSNKDFITQVSMSGGDVVSTDDSCFARVRGALPVELAFDLPSTGVDLLTKMLDRNDSPELRIANTDFHVIAEIGALNAPDRVVVAKLMREFPSTARSALVAPLTENRDALTVNADVLIDALRRATPTSDEETSAVALRVGFPQDGKIQIATRNRYGDLSEETIDGKFVVDGSETVASARTVVLNLDTLSKAVKAAVAASPLSDDATDAGSVTLLLGQPRSRSRPAWVVVQDGSKTVQSALSQVRSDWIS